jgi:predicted HD phosphohydrolase
MLDANPTDHATEERATFSHMTEGTAEDWAKIAGAARGYGQGLVGRIVDHLMLLDGDHGGFNVDRLTHSLQSATLAQRAGQDDEYIACALLHDIGDTLGCYNHADIGAAILKPFVSARNHWIVEHHGIFQGYYFFHHLGLDRDMREQFRGHPDFEACAQFCHLYDQNAFDPGYDTMPLDAFLPVLERVFAKPKNSIYKKPDGETF